MGGPDMVQPKEESMKQRVIAGGHIDALTTDEFVKLFPRHEQLSHVRAAETGLLNGSGYVSIDVYKVPMGMEFGARRVTIVMNTATDPSTGEVALNVSGKYVVYQRSGQFIEYGMPAYGSSIQVPGLETWGDQQGPTLRNGEVFQVVAYGLTAGSQLTATVEGLLKRPSTESHR
jgi:hypothetical protein